MILVPFIESKAVDNACHRFKRKKKKESYCIFAVMYIHTLRPDNVYIYTHAHTFAYI